jgi:hypothetical protein
LKIWGKKVCGCFVPHLLMLDQKHQHDASVEFVEVTDDDKCFKNGCSRQ